MQDKKITKFTDLIAWQEGHKLVLEIYKVTDKFPKQEIFGLVNQMRRCAVSITSCIAEGFSRSTPKDKNNFYYMTLGSVTELQNQLLVSKDLEYLSKDEFVKLAEKTVTVQKLTNGLIRYNKNKNRK